MPTDTYKMTKLVGESAESIEAAAQTALRVSAEKVDHQQWAHLTDIRASLNEDGSVKQWQVTVEVAFAVED